MHNEYFECVCAHAPVCTKCPHGWATWEHAFVYAFSTQVPCARYVFGRQGIINASIHAYKSHAFFLREDIDVRQAQALHQTK
jgi:hypothetical protein